MKVVSIGGIANDEVNYYMSLEFPFSQPSLRLEHTRREGGDPLVTRARREALVMNLGILIPGYDEGTTKTRREALLAALDTDAAAIPLIVEDDDGGDDRYRYVVVQGVDEQRGEEGPGQYLVATLVTYGETRWRANTPRSETWAVTGSGDTTVIANNGSLPARPVYTVKPTDAKSGATNAFEYRAFCAVKWRGAAATFYPTDVTDGTWDTSTLIAGFKINDGGTGYEANVGVQVDGRYARRWFSNFDQPFTGVWVNLDWQYCPVELLLTGFGSGDTVTEIVIDPEGGDISAFPFSGILQINNELFTYESRDVATGTFGGVARAAKGSTAANHDAGDEIYLIQHDIWLVYGGTGLWLNSWAVWASGDDLEPVIDLNASANASWQWDEFGETATPRRPARWRPGGAPDGTSTTNDPWDVITISNNSFQAEQTGASFWSVPIAHYVTYARIIGRGFSYESGTYWEAGLYIGGAAYIEIPQLIEGVGDELMVDFDLDANERRYGEDVRIYQRSGGAMEIRLDWVRLDWENSPTVWMSGEIAVYDLALTLENMTAGQSMDLTLAMALDEQLEVDTADHTVTLLDDASSQYQALTRSTRRREILPLLPGNNTLRVTEDGLQGVTIYITFEERSYS